MKIKYLLSALLILPVFASAQDIDKDRFQGVSDQDQRDINREIKYEMNRTLREIMKVREKQLAAELDFKLDSKGPTNSIRGVFLLVDEYLKDQSVKKYPNSLVDKAFQKYKPKIEAWERGMKVTLKVKKGMPLEEYEGMIRDVSSTSITINNSEIPRRMIHPDMIPHFDATERLKLKNAFMSRVEKKLLAERKEFIENNRLDAERKIFADEGYLRIAGDWVSKYEYFHKKAKEEEEAIRKKLIVQLDYKHHYAKGYVKFEGKWYTPEERAILIEERRIEESLKPPIFMAEMDTLHMITSQSSTGAVEPDDKKETGDNKGKEDWE